MNKLAAGALALALGLGAVAPAVAAESKKEEVAQYTGAQHFLTEYNAELKKVNKLYADYLAAKENEAAKLKVLNEKKAALELAIKNFEDYVGKKEVVTKIVKIIEDGATEDEKTYEKVVLEVVREERDYHVVLAREAYNKVLELTTNGAEKLGTLDTIIATPDYVAPRAELTLKEDKEEHKLALSEALDTLENEAHYLYKAPLDQAKIMELAKKVRVAVLERNIAQTEYNEAVKKTAAAWNAYVALRDKLVELAGKYNVVVQIGNDGIQVVDKDDAHVKPIGEKKSKEELVKELKAAIQKNKVAIESAEFLLENAPKSVAKVKGKLEAQIVTAKAALAKAEAALEKLEGKKMALVATAYADEDVSVDELESLIKENEDAANAINETIKENEKEQPEVEEEKPEEKPEEKEEDKKEEKKPAKKAGNNARTGIAGVAGVAGILAAASVAYAASKRD